MSSRMSVTIIAADYCRVHCVASRRDATRRVTSRRVTSRHVTSHVTPRQVSSYRVTSRNNNRVSGNKLLRRRINCKSNLILIFSKPSTASTSPPRGPSFDLLTVPAFYLLSSMKPLMYHFSYLHGVEARRLRFA